MIKKFLIEKFFKKANENMSLSMYKKAIKYLDRILLLDKNNVDALEWKGHCYASMYNKTDSLKCYELAFKLLPNSNELLIRKGSSYYILDEYNLAIDCFKELIIQNPQIFIY